MAVSSRPHAVMIPFPAQGHISPMMQLSQILSARGYYITLVNTEFSHERLLKSGLPTNTLANFRFVTIPDGLPSNHGRTQKPYELCEAMQNNGPAHFDKLVDKLKGLEDVPPFTCMIYDGILPWVKKTATRLKIPGVSLWTTSACGFNTYLSVPLLIEKGYLPLKDISGLEEEITFVPGMPPFRVKAVLSDPTDFMYEFVQSIVQTFFTTDFLILNTFEELEDPVLQVIKSKLPVYSIGPLLLSSPSQEKNESSNITASTWTEETEYVEWLDNQQPSSVIYVCFGSMAVMSDQELVEFAWGLESSNQSFLWAIRPDLVRGSSAVLPIDFMDKVKGRGFFVSWAPQMELLSHPSVGGFLTHSGWNSTIESICAGVPMICCPFFADQQMNRTFVTEVWKIGIGMHNVVKRGEVEEMVGRLMRGEEGKQMRRRIAELRDCAFNAVKEGGSSYNNLEKVLLEIEGRKNI